MSASSSSPTFHPADQASSPFGSLFVTREWFDVLAEYGLPSGIHRTDACIGKNLRLHLLRDRGDFQSLSSYYSADFGLQDGWIPSASEAQLVANWFRENRARHIALRPLHERAPFLQILISALCESGYLCDTFHVSTNWYLPCSGLSWSDYLASRPSRLANTLRRCSKRLGAEAGFRLEIVMEEAQLDSALRAYASVYAQSWKEPEPYPDFIPQLCRMSAKRGWLRLGVLYVGDEPAAAQIWFVKDGTASIYKLAYDSRFARLGVGTVLTAALTKHALDVDKVREIDFLTGDDAYKSEWMTHSRKLVGLLAWDTRSPWSLMRAASHFGRKWIQRAGKESAANG